MADITGEFGGHTYEAMWDRASASRVTWTATVRRDGEWVGSPSGRLLANDAGDDSIEVMVRLAVETAIDGGVGVQR
jgi:hypothetical protein